MRQQRLNLHEWKGFWIYNRIAWHRRDTTNRFETSIIFQEISGNTIGMYVAFSIHCLLCLDFSVSTASMLYLHAHSSRNPSHQPQHTHACDHIFVSSELLFSCSQSCFHCISPLIALLVPLFYAKIFVDTVWWHRMRQGKVFLPNLRHYQDSILIPLCSHYLEHQGRISVSKSYHGSIRDTRNQVLAWQALLHSLDFGQWQFLFVIFSDMQKSLSTLNWLESYRFCQLGL